MVAGKVLAVFQDAEKWNGGCSMEDWWHKIDTSTAMSAVIAKTWVRDKLPLNGKFAPLALKMIDWSME